MIDMRKRLKGAPVCGTISIVVTDIEDFSGLFFYAHYFATLCCQMTLGFGGDGTFSYFTRPSVHKTLNLKPRLHPRPSTPAELMKAYPELMMPALLTHNHLIQKAKWANFGFTIEQEGDSYALLFEEAGDAVAFCLQVSLALAALMLGSWGGVIDAIRRIMQVSSRSVLYPQCWGWSWEAQRP